MKVRECICGRGEACKNVSTAFYRLRDPRGSFTKVPKLVTFPEYFHDLQSNDLREALLHHILPPGHVESFDNTSQAKYIANHHFHPKIVLRCAKGRRCILPKFISGQEMNRLNMNLNWRETATDSDYHPTGEYYVVPNYSFAETVSDLKRRIANHSGAPQNKRISRARKERAVTLLEELYRNSGPTRDKYGELCPNVPISTKEAPYDDIPLPRETTGRKDIKVNTKEGKNQAETKHDHPAYPYSSFDGCSEMAEHFAIMKTFESKRRANHGLKLEIAHSRWSSTLALLQETQSGEQDLLDSVCANPAYITSLEAISDGMTKTTRYGHPDRSTGHSNSKLPRGNSRHSFQDERDNHQISGMNYDSEEKNRGYLSHFLETEPPRPPELCFKSSDVATMSVDTGLTTFLGELQTNIDQLEELGKEIIEQLESAEAKVEKAWGEFLVILCEYSYNDSLLPVRTLSQNL